MTHIFLCMHFRWLQAAMLGKSVPWWQNSPFHMSEGHDLVGPLDICGFEA